METKLLSDTELEITTISIVQKDFYLKRKEELEQSLAEVNEKLGLFDEVSIKLEK